MVCNHWFANLDHNSIQSLSFAMPRTVLAPKESFAKFSITFIHLVWISIVFNPHLAPLDDWSIYNLYNTFCYTCSIIIAHVQWVVKLLYLQDLFTYYSSHSLQWPYCMSGFIDVHICMTIIYTLHFVAIDLCNYDCLCQVSLQLVIVYDIHSPTIHPTVFNVHLAHLDH